MEYSALLNKLFIFVVLMVIGYGMARKGILDRSFTKAASNLTLNVFMSATILNSVLSLNLELDLAMLGRVMLVLWVMQLIGYLTAALLSRVIPCDPDHRPGFELLMSMGNSMFIALPIVEGIYGPVAVFYVSLSCIPFNILLFSYGVWLLRSDPNTRGIRLKDMLSVPLVVTLFSLLLFFLDLPIPGAIRGLLSALSGATMPMSMLVIGSSLGTVSLLDAFRNGKLYLASAARLLLIPLITWLVCRMLTTDPVLLMTTTIIAACPSAIIITVLSIQYGRDAVFTAEGTLQSTALSMLTIPLLVWLLR